LTHHLWDDLTQQIHGFLSGISLADLVARREMQSVSARQDSLLAARNANEAQVLNIAGNAKT
ncbi:MAG: hypothetical protein KJO62_12080, partial [Gammaproteobacteria bacterium]|nr:hypothetical protein [Gammaproteobacteria bacterium]